MNFLLVFYLTFAVLMLLPLLGAWFMVRRMPEYRISLILVAASTLLLTPSWGLAAIAVVLVSFGLLFIAALFTWPWGSLGRWWAYFRCGTQ
jgi:hypothetical protein